MAMIEWNISLLVGVKEIDQHHKYLVQLLNDTYDEYIVGINIELTVMDHLLAYMKFCFECEEQWMVKASYPNAEHKEEHALFSRRLVEIHKNFRQDANTSIEILLFLSNWVNYHIRKTDSKFRNFVEAQNLGKKIVTLNARQSSIHG